MVTKTQQMLHVSPDRTYVRGVGDLEAEEIK